MATVVVWSLTSGCCTSLERATAVNAELGKQNIARAEPAMRSAARRHGATLLPDQPRGLWFTPLCGATPEATLRTRRTQCAGRRRLRRMGLQADLRAKRSCSAILPSPLVRSFARHEPSLVPSGFPRERASRVPGLRKPLSQVASVGGELLRIDVAFRPHLRLAHAAPAPFARRPFRNVETTKPRRDKARPALRTCGKIHE